MRGRSSCLASTRPDLLPVLVVAPVMASAYPIPSYSHASIPRVHTGTASTAIGATERSSEQPLPFPTRRATMAAAACANVFANPSSL
jgi:hypothetical protein